MVEIATDRQGQSLGYPQTHTRRLKFNRTAVNILVTKKINLKVLKVIP